MRRRSRCSRLEPLGTRGETQGKPCASVPSCAHSCWARLSAHIMPRHAKWLLAPEPCRNDLGAVAMLRCRGWIVDVVYAAIVPSAKLAARASDDAAAAKLWPLAEIPMPLAVDHATILAAVFRLVCVHLAVRIVSQSGACSHVFLLGAVCIALMHSSHPQPTLCMVSGTLPSPVQATSIDHV